MKKRRRKGEMEREKEAGRSKRLEVPNEGKEGERKVKLKARVERDRALGSMEGFQNNE